MYGWRVTKYDPAKRREDGAYEAEEWTSIADIGKEIGGHVLTEADYLATENRYVEAALAFLRESDVQQLTVTDLEAYEVPDDVSVDDGQVLDLDGIPNVIRLALQERVWCKLVAPDRFFLHFGYDYYMYVGSHHKCPRAQQKARELGLFPEPMRSPYL